MILFDDRRRALHDRLVKTVVVYRTDRAPRSMQSRCGGEIAPVNVAGAAAPHPYGVRSMNVRVVIAEDSLIVREGSSRSSRSSPMSRSSPPAATFRS